MSGPALRAVCVTGMHRSGTSLAARALDVLGLSFGDAELLMQPGPDNVAGYWENRLIKELDNDLLAHLGGSWDSPPVLEEGWADDDSLEEFRVRGAEILDLTFGRDGSETLVAWKDPRLSLLLPFWRTVTPVVATVVCVRNPTEVASSLEKRDGLRPPQACLLWLRYLLAAIDNDPEHHLVVSYGSFFDDPAGTLAAMADHLSIPRPDDRQLGEVTVHLDPALRHHVASASPEEEEHANPIVSLAHSVWNGGAIATDVLEPTTRRAVAQGWLRPPVDTEAFDRTRARNVDLTELFRRRSRKRALTGDDLDEHDLNEHEPLGDEP